MTNPWQEYKKKLGGARPWDFLNPKTEYEDEDVSIARLEICESCPRLIKTTKQCRECGCFMALKVKLKNAACPINKW
jgi:hypothetical protein